MQLSRLTYTGIAFIAAGVLMFGLAQPVAASTAQVAVSSAAPITVCAGPTSIAEPVPPVAFADSGLVDSPVARFVSGLLLTAAMLVASINVVSTPTPASAMSAANATVRMAGSWAGSAAPTLPSAPDHASATGWARSADTSHVRPLRV